MRALQIFSHSTFTTLHCTSSLYETEPIILKDQPDFLNAVAKLSTCLSPLDLLRYLKNIELWMGRKPGLPKGPRLIDLDLLLLNDVTMQSTQLTIPHPQMYQRRFVLIPLLEIEPAMKGPHEGCNLIDYVKTTLLKGRIKLYSSQHPYRNPVISVP